MSIDSRILRRVNASELPGIRRDLLDERTLSIARSIVDDVRTNGLDALQRHAEKLGDVTRDQPLIYDATALAAARGGLDHTTRALLERTAKRISKFATAQRAA